LKESINWASEAVQSEFTTTSTFLARQVPDGTPSSATAASMPRSFLIFSAASKY